MTMVHFVRTGFAPLIRRFELGATPDTRVDYKTEWGTWEDSGMTVGDALVMLRLGHAILTGPDIGCELKQTPEVEAVMRLLGMTIPKEVEDPETGRVFKVDARGEILVKVGSGSFCTPHMNVNTIKRVIALGLMEVSQ